MSEDDEHGGGDDAPPVGDCPSVGSSRRNWRTFKIASVGWEGSEAGMVKVERREKRRVVGRASVRRAK